ncbi:helix-turn-helix transcriptional regulator [Zavarzinella formosa]|uniref:helix-turn-helix transcriptional regulator n=1 Tax=Zavarzinella formosa TaxID=360055 RepID=UPI00037BBFFD
MSLNNNEMLSITELAALLDVSRQAIYNWLESGTAPRNERFGGRVLFHKAEAEQFKSNRDQTK